MSKVYFLPGDQSFSIKHGNSEELNRIYLNGTARAGSIEGYTARARREGTQGRKQLQRVIMHRLLFS